jgi:hypothetical protein
MGSGMSRAEKKRSELIDLVASRLDGRVTEETAGALSDLAERLVDITSSISSPEAEPVVLELVTFRPGGSGGGRSVKAGNVLLDIKKLIVSAAKGTLAVKGVLLAPWTVPFAVLVLWDDLYSRLKVDIDEQEASVIWTLWMNRDAERCVPKANLLALVNAERAEYGRGPLSEEVLADALNLLCKMHCIQASKDGLHWRVTEWVRVRFS